MTPDPPAENTDPFGEFEGRRFGVTGAAGFIGSNLVARLLELEAEVIAIDALIPESDPEGNRREAWDAVTANDKVEGHLIDLRTDPLEPVLEGVDVLFNLAAMTGLHRNVDRSVYRSCNVEAAGNLASGCIEAGISRLIHTSTSSVYGAVATGKETSALEPISDYGRTKLEAEEVLEGTCDGVGPGLTILRLFSVYGPGQRPDMAYRRIIEAALGGHPFEVFGDGEQVRSNTFVGDIVDGLIRSLSDAAIGETMNLAGGEAVSLNEAIALIEQLTGQAVKRLPRPPRPGDQKYTEGDFSKAARLIGFEPRTRFEEGIALQIEWQSRGRSVGAQRRSTETATVSPGPGS